MQQDVIEQPKTTIPQEIGPPVFPPDVEKQMEELRERVTPQEPGK